MLGANPDERAGGDNSKKTSHNETKFTQSTAVSLLTKNNQDQTTHDGKQQNGNKSSNEEKEQNRNLSNDTKCELEVNNPSVRLSTETHALIDSSATLVT